MTSRRETPGDGDDLQWPVPEDVLDRFEHADTDDTGALMIDSADDWQATPVAPARPSLLDRPQTRRAASPSRATTPREPQRERFDPEIRREFDPEIRPQEGRQHVTRSRAAAPAGASAEEATERSRLGTWAAGFAAMALACAGVAVLLQDPRVMAGVTQVGSQASAAVSQAGVVVSQAGAQAGAAVERVVADLEPTVKELRDSLAGEASDALPASERLRDADEGAAATPDDPTPSAVEAAPAAPADAEGPSAPAATSPPVASDPAGEPTAPPAEARAEPPASAEGSEGNSEGAQPSRAEAVGEAEGEETDSTPAAPTEPPLSQRYLSGAARTDTAPASVREAARRAAMSETPGTPVRPPATSPAPSPSTSPEPSPSSDSTLAEARDVAPPSGEPSSGRETAALSAPPGAGSPSAAPAGSPAPGNGSAPRVPSTLAPAPPVRAAAAPSNGGATSPATASPVDPAASAASASRSDTDAIRAVLGGYRAAYQQLDVAAARQVWPTVDGAALARAFAGLRSQGIQFENCKVDVQGEKATAECTGWSTFVPRVGSRNPQSMWLKWEFALQKRPAGWKIVDVRTR